MEQEVGGGRPTGDRPVGGEELVETIEERLGDPNGPPRVHLPDVEPSSAARRCPVCSIRTRKPSGTSSRSVAIRSLTAAARSSGVMASISAAVSRSRSTPMAEHYAEPVTGRPLFRASESGRNGDSADRLSLVPRQSLLTRRATVPRQRRPTLGPVLDRLGPRTRCVRLGPWGPTMNQPPETTLKGFDETAHLHHVEDEVGSSLTGRRRRPAPAPQPAAAGRPRWSHPRHNRGGPGGPSATTEIEQAPQLVELNEEVDITADRRVPASDPSRTPAPDEPRWKYPGLTDGLVVGIMPPGRSRSRWG